jgi:hypothetical protein
VLSLQNFTKFWQNMREVSKFLGNACYGPHNPCADQFSKINTPIHPRRFRREVARLATLFSRMNRMSSPMDGHFFLRKLTAIASQAMVFAGALCILVCGPDKVRAQELVPGTGQRITQVGDDFEDPKWDYIANEPKSSEEQDHQERLPSGHSANGRWAEGLKRGQPDVVKRVPTPPGGIPGSEGSMLLMSLYTGVPGVFSGQTHQDDFICLVD